MKRLFPKLPAGKLTAGEGRISAYISFLLGALSLLGVLAFMFPAYLTTPDIRNAFNPEHLRLLMTGGLSLAAGFGAFAVFKQAERRFAWCGVMFALFAMLLGGPSVAVGDLTPSAFYIGVDWLIIGFISTAGLFVLLEKLAPLRADQAVFRDDWILDMKYFIFNHLAIGFFLFAGNFVVHNWFDWLQLPLISGIISDLPFLVQFGLLILFIDLMQYAVHRIYHETKFFWKVHSIHHSAETIDWLAGSRLNVLEALITRTLGLVIISNLGFGQGPISAYIIFVAFHSTFIHANFGLNLRWMESLFVTPKYHHWHHSDAVEAVNKNYAIYFTFIDKIFGTQYNPKHWPEGYGIVEGHPPEGLIRQQIYPFMGWKRKLPAS